MSATVVASVELKPRRIKLFLLLFLAFLGFLTGMVIRQTRTIIAQRSLIHLLIADNLHLRKHHAVQAYPAARANAHGATSASPRRSQAITPDQAPSAQAPSPQAPAERASSEQALASSEQTPSIQVQGKSRSQANAKSERKTRAGSKASPAAPPAELTDPSDMRRVLFSI